MALLNNPAFSSFIIILSKGVGFPVRDVIPFQFMPDSISDNKQANYNDVNIIARSVPVKSYSHSSARQISFTLDFFTAPEAGMKVVNPLIIKNRIDALKALVYPEYSTFSIKPPPRCIVHIGAQLSFLGVCRSVNVTYSNQSPWDLQPVVLAHHAKVALTFEEALNIPLSHTEVRQGLPVSVTGKEFASSYIPGGYSG